MTCATPLRSAAPPPAAAGFFTSLPIIGSGREIPAISTSRTSTGRATCFAAANPPGVERFVYTSTVGCIGIPPAASVTKPACHRSRKWQGAYKRSKFLAEQARSNMRAAGFPVVIVNPTAPMGDHDFKPTPTGQIVLDFLNGAMPAYIDTGLNVVNVRDVAEGHLLACEHGRVGERYILGSENLTLGQILRELASHDGPQSAHGGTPLLRGLHGGYGHHRVGAPTGTPPRAPLEAVRMAKKKMWVSHAKAAHGTRFRSRSGARGSARAVAWFEKSQKARKPPREPAAAFYRGGPRECEPWVARWESVPPCAAARPLGPFRRVERRPR